MRRAIRIFVFATLCSLFGENGSEAQQPAAANPTPQHPAETAPTPVPLSEIDSQGESAMEFLRKTEASLQTDRTAAEIEERLPVLAKQIDLEHAKLFLASPPLDLLNRQEVALRRYHADLSAWNRDLAEEAKTLVDQTARLKQLSSVWQMTLRSPDLSQAAPGLATRLQEIVDFVESLRKLAESRQTTVMALQGRILDLAAQVQRSSFSIEQEQARVMRTLLTPNRPPIWSRENLRRDQEQIRLLWGTSLSLLADYVRSHPGVFVLHTIVILILISILCWLRRELNEWTSEEPDLRRTAPVFELPVATGTALSFLVVGPLYSEAPLVLQAILGAVLIVPTAIILRRLVDKARYPILNALLVFYFVDQLRLVAVVLPFLSRVIFLAETAGATGILIWLIRGSRSSGESRESTSFARLARIVLRLGLVIFPATVLANILGYVNLANLLGNGALKSAYVAAVLYVGFRILEGLIIIALRLRPLALSRVVRVHRALLHRRLCAVLRFFCFLLWLSLTLKFFALWEPLVKYAGAALAAKPGTGVFSVSLGQVLLFVLTVWASLLVSRFLRFILEEDIYHHWRAERGIPQAISTMVHYAVLLVGFFAALAVLGVDLTKVTILAGAFTVGIGFGLQTVINNFVCGLILLFERPIKVGDVVQVDADVGEVRRIGIRACVIRTADGSEIILPNGTMISNKVKNWTFSDQHRAVEIQVNVARGVAPQRVVEVLRHVAAAHPGIVKEPPPHAYAVNFAPGAVTFQLRAWTDRYTDWVQVRSDLSLAVDDALTQQNIPIT